MPSHSEKRLLLYPAEEMFGLVKDVARYPEFLPWVSGARVLETHPDDNYFIAELLIGFKGFSGSYISRVSYSQPEKKKGNKEWAIYVDLEEGPFSFLENRWIFHPLGENKCEIEFFIDFSFKSKILEIMMGSVFDKAVHKMVGAFEERAKELHG